MNAIQLRPARPDDLPQLLAFEQGVIAAERPFDDTLSPDPIHYYDLQEMIHASHIKLIVAEVDGKLIGSGYARIEEPEPFFRFDRYAYLGFMYVVPEYRGQGVNQLVIDRLIAWAKERSIDEIQLQVYTGNKSAERAYEKLGFEPKFTLMRLSTK